ncbi:MAG: hypothetical protein K2M34_05300 [Alphaproteobacteria bacterium]|nr:hypothetical protein [Alphaproteobacteria bacterium]
MKKICFCLIAYAGIMASAHALNTTADMLRTCEGVSIGTTNNYILKCTPTDKIKNLMTDEHNMRQFFVADNGGDVRGTFLSQIPDNADYIYVNVASNLPDPRYENQTCYRFITEIDASRDGFYAVEVCEYERPDYYL